MLSIDDVGVTHAFIVDRGCSPAVSRPAPTVRRQYAHRAAAGWARRSFWARDVTERNVFGAVSQGAGTSLVDLLESLLRNPATRALLADSALSIFWRRDERTGRVAYSFRAGDCLDPVEDGWERLR